MASIKGPFPCWVDGCTAGPFFFFFSGHLAERHGSSACREQWGCLLYVCIGSSMVIVVFDCLGNLGGGESGNWASD